jgi:hypothetical protein
MPSGPCPPWGTVEARRSSSSALDSPGCHRGTGRAWEGIRSASRGGVTKVITENHGIASAVLREANRSQKWAMKGPEKLSTVPQTDRVTEAMAVNHSTASVLSFKADGSHEHKQREAAGGCEGKQRRADGGMKISRERLMEAMKMSNYRLMEAMKMIAVV